MAGAQRVVLTMVGVSLAQPGPWAILRGGSRVINLPAGIAPPTYRGEVLLHAAQTCNHDAFDEANRKMLRAGALPAGVLLPWSADLPRGGFVARARIVDVVMTGVSGGHRVNEPGGLCMLCGGAQVLPPSVCRVTDPWATPGGTAILLADVAPLPVFVPGPAPTTTGLAFQLDGPLFDRALAAAVAATTDAELAAVASVWREAPRSKRRARVASVEATGMEARA